MLLKRTRCCSRPGRLSRLAGSDSSAAGRSCAKLKCSPSSTRSPASIFCRRGADCERLRHCLRYCLNTGETKCPGAISSSGVPAPGGSMVGSGTSLKLRVLDSGRRPAAGTFPCGNDGIL